MTNTRARELIDTGYRMPAPDGTPDEIYQLMLRLLLFYKAHLLFGMCVFLSVSNPLRTKQQK